MRIQRINEIENYLNINNSASVKELCDRFKVSLNTIRRDIDELHKRGIISKVYGGIVLNQETGVVPFSTRSVYNKDEKELICEIASSLLVPGSTIYIDSGTTTIPLLKHVKPSMNITIVSNSLNVFNEASNYPGLNVISLGGLFSEKTNSFIGIAAINHLREYHIHKAFMTATAISIESGATNNSYHESEIKKVVISQSNEIVMMADNTKLSKQASLSFANLNKINAFVTDKKPDKKYIDFFNSNNIDLLYT
jgi:DeoR family transcriptional regulator, myo-inositol catabolism operon repressor